MSIIVTSKTDAHNSIHHEVVLNSRKSIDLGLNCKIPRMPHEYHMIYFLTSAGNEDRKKKYVRNGLMEFPIERAHSQPASIKIYQHRRHDVCGKSIFSVYLQISQLEQRLEHTNVRNRQETTDEIRTVPSNCQVVLGHNVSRSYFSL